MRNLRKFKDKSQPFTVVVCFNAATHVPEFALTNYGLNIADKMSVTVLGVEVPLYMQIGNVRIHEGRPQGTGGLIRSSATFEITSVGPYARDPFSKTLYSAGSNVDTTYFGIWVIDYAESVGDINEGAFFGYYKLDADVGWNEGSLVTTISLIGILQMQTGRYSESMAAAETVLDGSEYSPLLTSPAYLGYRGKIKCVGRTSTTVAGYENVAKTAITGVVAGMVQSATLSGTSIVLGRSPTLATLVGQVVKLKMGNGCIIRGTITDLTGGEYGIDTTGLVLNDKWDTITAFQVGYNTGDTSLTSAVLPSTISIVEEIDTIPSPTMYLKSTGPVEFYPDPTVTPGPVFLRLNGLAEEATKRFSIDDFTWIDGSSIAHPRTLVNVEYHATQQNTVFSGDDAHLCYATWTVPQTYDLYFTKATFALVDIQRTGMTWELVATPYVNTAASFPNAYYVKLLNGTTIATDSAGNTNLFYDNGSELVVIPATDITSITYDCNDFSIPNLCRILLVNKPSVANESYANGYIYADVGPTKYAGEILTWILQQAGLGSIAALHLTSADNKVGNIMSLVLTNETWGELIDSVLFESGCTIRFEYGKAILLATGYDVEVKTWTRGASGDTYFRAEPKATIDYKNVIDNSVSLQIGRTYTSTDIDGREYVRVHYEFSYPYSEYNGTQLKKLTSNKTAKNNDRIIDYTFKHVCDKDTASVAIQQMTRIGHAANIPETTRTYTFAMGFDAANICAMDPVRLKDFKHVTMLDEPLPEYRDEYDNYAYSYGEHGLVCCKYTQAVPYMLTPGLCVVEEVTYDFGSDGTPVTFKLKQVQFGTECNLREVADALHMPTDVENTDAGQVDYPTANYLNFPTVTCALATFFMEVKPTSVNFSTVVADDPCCDSTTTASEVSDVTVTAYCGWWPDYCSPVGLSISSEAIDGSTIDTGAGVTFRLLATMCNTMGDDATGYGIDKIEYDGKEYTPGCVFIGAGGGNGAATEVLAGGGCTEYNIGELVVMPCAFEYPTNTYGKTVDVIFTVSNCYTSGWSIPFTRTVSVHVNLQPVSDISI